MKPLQPAILSLGLAGVSAGLAGAGGIIAAPLATAISIGSALGVAGVVGLASARPDLGWFGPTLCRANHPGCLALTIDDGPDPVSTPLILDAVEAVGGRATFFVLLDRAEAHPQLLRSISARGHEVALHGTRHDARYTVLSAKAGAADLAAAASRLADLCDAQIRWFRPPFGAVSPRVYAAAERAGLPIAWCSIRTGDGGFASPKTILERCANAVATDIVLMHDGSGYAAKLMPQIVADWDARGISLATLTACMARPA